MTTKAIETAALRLFKHPGTTRAIDHYRRNKVMETMLTLEQHMIELKAIRDTGKAAGPLSAAVRAEELRRRIAGFVRIDWGL